MRGPQDHLAAERLGMKKFAIIGAGLAGLACADELIASGHSVRLFDKARGPGGRMSTRRTDSASGQVSFDHGAQYFTARDPSFQSLIETWSDAGIVARWPAAGADAWVGVPTMNAPVKQLAGRHDVTWSAHIEALLKGEDGWHLKFREGALIEPFDHMILAIPAEQAADLLAPTGSEFAAIAAKTVSAPCWTLMLAYDEPLNTGKIILRDDGVIGWAARNSDKPGRMGPESWVVQAAPQWSIDHVENDQDAVAKILEDRLAELLGITLPAPLVRSAHRWRYARSGRTEFSALYSEEMQLGVCGDWLLGPRVECAWLSGTSLGKMIPT